MPRADRPLARRVRSLWSVDLLEVLHADERPARELRFQLRARSVPSPFRARDLVDGRGASRRNVYRRIDEWKGAHVVESDIASPARVLSWNPRTRALQTGGRPSRNRGRPADRFRFVDPLPTLERPGPAELRAVARFMRGPVAAEFLVWLLRQPLRLVVDRVGRDFMRNQMGRALPRGIHATWGRLVDAMESLDSSGIAEIARVLDAEIRANMRVFGPQIATLMEIVATALERDPRVGETLRAILFEPGKLADLRAASGEGSEANKTR